ncbi:MAG: PA2778 family cysteine peptidase [Gammaproteobacteria bacterium]|nr:PA2778 family cysteine peptidase [Gammaproteobacteria bacterium]
MNTSVLRAAGLALIMAIGLSGCASIHPAGYIKQTPPADLGRAIVLADVPFYPQKRYQCGPAALATVLNHYGVAVTPYTLKPLVYIPERKGSVQTEMLAAGRSYDMLAYVIEPNLDSLFYEVAAGHPTLVMQNLGLSWLPRWHYAVVVGYDLDANQIILRSGATKEWRTTIANFDTTWARSKRWAVVYMPAGEIPKTAKPLPYLKSALALEQTGHKNAALKSYQAAAQRWPEDLLSTMARGNFAANNGDWMSAEQAFHQTLKYHPKAAEAWNNLGHVLAQQHCAIEAREAVECAIELTPDNVAFRQLLDEINSDENKVGSDCQPVRCPSSH